MSVICSYRIQHNIFSGVAVSSQFRLAPDFYFLKSNCRCSVINMNFDVRPYWQQNPYCWSRF